MKNTRFTKNLKGFPKAIIRRMTECQEEQGNQKNAKVFDYSIYTIKRKEGFNWEETSEGKNFWQEVLTKRNFKLFFEKYPKQQRINISLKEEQSITLPNGDIAEVTVKIKRKPIELKVGNKYKLKRASEFCHITSSNNSVESNEWIFVGTINLPIGDRNIFYKGNKTYIMYSAKNLDYVVEEVE